MVGYLMLRLVARHRLRRPEAAIPCFLIIVGVPMTFSIAAGIGFGDHRLRRGDGRARASAREVSLLMWVLVPLFLAFFEAGWLERTCSDPRRTIRGMAQTLERDAELDRIAAALDAAQAGRGHALLIEGVAGIGKSRLIADARALAKLRGFGRLQAAGDELEQAMPWSVVRQMVERSISRYSGADREALLAAPAGAALRTLDDAPPEAPAGDAAVARTLHALWWVAADLAAFRPLLITVDDAQWSDLPSLRFLVYLSRRIADLPIALVVASRPPTDSSGPLAELSAARDLERVEPRPLSAAAIRELAGGADPAPEVVAAVHAATGGNPFLATTLLDELGRRGLSAADAGTADRVGGLGPSAISRALLSRLGPEAGRLAAAAAVLGLRAEPWLTGELAGLTTEQQAAATGEMLAAGVIAADRDQVTFAHPVIREAVLADVPAAERAALHGRAARRLHAARRPARAWPPTSPRPRPARCPAPSDLLAAPRASCSPRATPPPRPATSSARGTSARRTTSCGPSWACALLRSGRAAEAREHLRAAGRGRRASRRTAPRTWPRSPPRCWRSTASPPPSTRSARAGRLARRRRRAHGPRGAPGPAARPPRRPGRRAHRAPAPLRGRAGRHAARARAARARRPALALRRRAGRAHRRPRPARPQPRRVPGRPGRRAWRGCRAGSRRSWPSPAATASTPRARRSTAPVAASAWAARRRSSPSRPSSRRGWRSAAATCRRPSPSARRAWRPSAARTRPRWWCPIRTAATSIAVTASLDLGDAAAAQAFADGYPATFEEAVIPSLWVAWPRARLALDAGDAASALRELLRLRETLADARITTPTMPWQTTAVPAALRLGREQEAADLARQLHEQAARRARRATSARRCGCGPGSTPTRGSSSSSGPWPSSSARRPGWSWPGALVDLGEALRVARRRSDAREVLRRGADLAVACGARPLRQRAADALAALGDRPRALMFSGVEGLTASERRIAELARGGRSNRDIAQELFVTPKTVENHLGKVYLKLGISGRRELAGSLA